MEIKLDGTTITPEALNKKLEESRVGGPKLKEVSPGNWKTLKKLRD